MSAIEEVGISSDTFCLRFMIAIVDSFSVCPEVWPGLVSPPARRGPRGPR